MREDQSADPVPFRFRADIAHEAVDRHAASAHAKAVALRCVARDDSVSCVTYGDLARATARFSNVLRTLGTGLGDRVVTLLGRCPELYTVVLGTLKNTSVLCPGMRLIVHRERPRPEPVDDHGTWTARPTCFAMKHHKPADCRAGAPPPSAGPGR